MKHLAVASFLLFLLAHDACGAPLFAGKVLSHRRGKHHVRFSLANATLDVTVVETNVIRFRASRRAFSPAPSYAVVQTPKAGFTVKSLKSEVEIRTTDLVVRVQKDPCRVRIYDSAMNLLSEDEPGFGMSFDGDEVRCYKRLFPDERFYGLGEKTGDLEKRGQCLTMWNSDNPGYAKTQDPLYCSIPFVLGLREGRAWGLLFDNTYRSTFNLGASNRRFWWFGAERGELDYTFIAGPDVKRVVSSYADLTGKMGLPPQWGLGYQQSKWSYQPEAAVRTLARTFREKKIPCDVIYLDIDYMDGYRVFTWDGQRFPDPPQMLTDLREEGFKVVPIIDPGVKADAASYTVAAEGLKGKHFATYPDGEVFQAEVWPSWAYFPDFTNPATRTWWGTHVTKLLLSGVRGIWNDMNEPAAWGQAVPDFIRFSDQGHGADLKKIKNVYALEMARATHEVFRTHTGKRPFILTRAGFAGIQRYAAVWTGDNVASNDHLALACVMLQGMGLSGLPFVGSDVGGFIGTPSPALFVRWMQLGVFSPFFRGHNAINQPDKEPWSFGQDTERLVRETIELRYRLLPFLYTLFEDATQTGLPILRPMLMEFQNDPVCLTNECQHQFMIGDHVLVAPVVNDTDRSKKVYLPRGRWLQWQAGKERPPAGPAPKIADLNIEAAPSSVAPAQSPTTGMVHEGGRWIQVEAPLDTVPVFLREGAFVPHQESQNHVGEKVIIRMTVDVFPCASASGTLYEDDGEGFNYDHGDFVRTTFSLTADALSTLEVLRTKGVYQTALKTWLFRIHDVPRPGKVTCDGRRLREQADLSGEGQPGFAYDVKNRRLDVRLPVQAVSKLTWE